MYIREKNKERGDDRIHILMCQRLRAIERKGRERGRGNNARIHKHAYFIRERLVRPVARAHGAADRAAQRGAGEDALRAPAVHSRPMRVSPLCRVLFMSMMIFVKTVKDFSPTKIHHHIASYHHHHHHVSHLVSGTTLSPSQLPKRDVVVCVVDFFKSGVFRVGIDVE